jgi:hypothetical protein
MELVASRMENLWEPLQGGECSSQLHPVVVPQSSHTMQWPLTFMRMLLQLLH